MTTRLGPPRRGAWLVDPGPRRYKEPLRSTILAVGTLCLLARCVLAVAALALSSIG